MLQSVSNVLDTMPSLPHGSNSLELRMDYSSTTTMEPIEEEELEEEDGGRRINIDFYTALVTWRVYP